MNGHLHHTGLTVKDLDRSIAFYGDLLGFEVTALGEREGGYFGAVVGYPDVKVRLAYVAPPDSAHKLELFQYVSPPSRGEGGEPRDVGMTHVCLIVDDLPGIHERLSAAGVEFFSEPVYIDHGVNEGGRAVYLRDPDGIILELFQPPSHGLI